jgi:hypothetical protein
MVDPTPEEVAAAIETLKAFETSLHTPHPVAAPVEPGKPSEVIPPPPAAPAAEAPTPEAPAKVDPYLAKSVKSSPNGF